MPRKNYPVKPFIAMIDYVNGRKINVVVSANGLTYHHEDEKWRYRRLNDSETYSFSTKAAASKCADIMNKNIVLSDAQ